MLVVDAQAGGERCACSPSRRGRWRRGGRARGALPALAVAAPDGGTCVRAGARAGEGRRRGGEPAPAAVRGRHRRRARARVGALARATAARESSARSRGRSPRSSRGRASRLLWSDGARQGAVSLAAFSVPFGLLALMLARLPWQRRWLKALALELIAMAVVFAGSACASGRPDVFWNPKVIIGNVYAPFYRVNSLFWDLLDLRSFPRRRDPRRARGRALRRRRDSIVAAFTVVGSLDRSRLLVLPVELRRARCRRARGDRASRGATLGRRARAARFLACSPQASSCRRARGDPRQHRPCDGEPLDACDGGPAHRRDHPLGGVGLGGFESAYGERVRLPCGGPGAGGVAQHAGHRRGGARRPGLCSCSLGLSRPRLWLPFRRASRSFAGRASLCFGLALLAILVHSLFYNAFFEDPMSWSLLGLSALGYAWRSSTRASRAARTASRSRARRARAGRRRRARSRPRAGRRSSRPR